MLADLNDSDRNVGFDEPCPVQVEACATVLRKMTRLQDRLAPLIMSSDEIRLMVGVLDYPPPHPSPSPP